MFGEREAQAMKMPYTEYLRRPSGVPLIYYVTDRHRFPGDEEEKRRRLLKKIAECAAAQVDYIQLREKDMSVRDLENLARNAMELLPKEGRTKLLINSRTDVALACGAHGVHLPAYELPAAEVRAIFGRLGNIHPVIAVSAHSVEELAYAEAQGADFAVFGPVFEKNGDAVGGGLEKLQEACLRPDRAMPVLAIGGVTLQNTPRCLSAGADGIAAIRMFQEGDVIGIRAALGRGVRRE
jgi:thiamine-phosphate pyrophosphorylase